MRARRPPAVAARAPRSAAPPRRPRPRSLRRRATVVADPLRIAQACANLIGNAAEHGEGEVRVRVLAVGQFVRLEVADDGPGLPASVTALTAHARARRGPRGHGLAIAAAIARDHGGRLFAPGARIVLELPAAGGGCGRKPAQAQVSGHTPARCTRDPAPAGGGPARALAHPRDARRHAHGPARGRVAGDARAGGRCRRRPPGPAGRAHVGAVGPRRALAPRALRAARRAGVRRRARGTQTRGAGAVRRTS